MRDKPGPSYHIPSYAVRVFPISPQLLYVSPANSRVFLGASTQNSAFVTKWSADGSQILYSTYLGGNGYDQPAAIAVDETGNAYLTGSTSSAISPLPPARSRPSSSAPRTCLSRNFTRPAPNSIYSTLSGTKPSMPAGIAVDDSGDAVITGSTQGGFPVTPERVPKRASGGCTIGSAYPIIIPSTGDAFVTKIASAGNALVYSTLLGGTCYTSARTWRWMPMATLG